MKNPNFGPLDETDLEQLVTIEARVYSHPWTSGNFSDAFKNDYPVFGLYESSPNGLKEVFAYFVLMPILDELHLLNFAVDQRFHGQGLAKIMLDKMHEYALKQQAISILLEVRESNERAIKLYSRYGFVEIGRRKGYYPITESLRESAVVMRMELNTNGVNFE